MRESANYPCLFVGRVISQSRDLYKTATGVGDIFSEISGKLRHGATSSANFPAVGDFVMLDRADDSTGHAIIHHVLPRKSAFIRKAAGTSADRQVVAANIDTVFICMALGADYNLRRLERYLSIAWDSGATPVVVLTKSDLCPDIAVKLAEVATVAIGLDVLLTSGLCEDGAASLRQRIKSGETYAFIGSSGVGKSTLINRLIGEERQTTKETRSDDKGRHATTRRDLIVLESGGALIDTPGMREIGIENANLSRAFSEIDELAKECRFSDCAHKNEPGCVVLAAIEDGTLNKDRLKSYHKLKKEAKYEGLNSRQIESEKIDAMFSEFGGIKNARKFIREKNNGK
ncbi:MAG: ribosome small subunit-dependent GTPase A [Eubacteriales bacterium]|nr:ribosome small subunit-dependent GTPase A [Eubacteriales bacterium]